MVSRRTPVESTAPEDVATPTFCVRASTKSNSENVTKRPAFTMPGAPTAIIPSGRRCMIIRRDSISDGYTLERMVRSLEVGIAKVRLSETSSVKSAYDSPTEEVGNSSRGG